MKKILSFLSVFSLVISGTSNIIACNDSKDLEFTDKELFDFKTKGVLNNGYVDVYKNIKDNYPNINTEIIKEKEEKGRILWGNNIGLSNVKLEFTGDYSKTSGNETKILRISLEFKKNNKKGIYINNLNIVNNLI